jgi:hypothetical protein
MPFKIHWDFSLTCQKYDGEKYCVLSTGSMDQTGWFFKLMIMRKWIKILWKVSELYAVRLIDDQFHFPRKQEFPRFLLDATGLWAKCC